MITISLHDVLLVVLGAVLMLYAVLCYVQWSELKDLKDVTNWKQQFRFYMWPSGWVMLKLRGKK